MSDGTFARPGMSALETDRVAIRRFTLDDAAFVLELINEPSWHRFIGDKGIRTMEGARDYLLHGPLATYDRHGFGLMRMALKHSDVPIGMCGLIKRDALEDVDIGFAMLPTWGGHGYAFEAASAVLAYGRNTLRIRRVIAITSLDNDRSIRLLEAIGLTFERTLKIGTSDEELRMYGIGP